MAAIGMRSLGRAALVRSALAAAALAIIGLGTALNSPVEAREEIPAETRILPFSAALLPCDADAVLHTIQYRFNRTERKFWGGTVEIVGFEKARQAAFRPHGLDLVPRRYCQATAILSNNRKTVVRYAIINKYGLAAHWDSVQYCVQGYDRNHTAMANCSRLDR